MKHVRSFLKSIPRDIHFWASVAQIFSIVLAILFFRAEHIRQQEQDRTEYIHRIESLRFELNKNQNVTLEYFRRDRADILAGRKIMHFRYSVAVLNGLIGEGKIRNQDLLRDLDAIADDENQANRVLDAISMMGEMSQVGSVAERDMFMSRIKTASEVAVNLTDSLAKFLPVVIQRVDKHIDEVNTGKPHQPIGGKLWTIQ